MGKVPRRPGALEGLQVPGGQRELFPRTTFAGTRRFAERAKLDRTAQPWRSTRVPLIAGFSKLEYNNRVGAGVQRTQCTLSPQGGPPSIMTNGFTI
jgi:hypothetical protein